jgi:hypothetical protein
MDTKEMRSKFFLAIILLTPIVVITLFVLSVSFTGRPIFGTKENGEFFKSYFDFNHFKDSRRQSDLIEF